MNPSRGEVWLIELDPVRGHEQAGTRPALVISVDKFNQGPADLVIILPITSKSKNIPSHVRISAGEGGLDRDSYIKCEDVRSVSKTRLVKRLGQVDYKTLEDVGFNLRVLLGLN